MDCLNCGETFKALRSTAKYCSSRCRVQYHRDAKSKEDDFNETANEIYRLITKLSEFVYDDDFSEDACVNLNAIISHAQFVKPNNDSSWWRCKKCNVAVKRSFPDKTSCDCKEPKWVLQKTFI